ALNHRQMSEAARILQGALVGARDKAIHAGEPSGIRLLPDPAFYSLQTTGQSAGQLVPSASLAYNRIIPIEPAPQYSEGMCTTVPQSVYAGLATGTTTTPFIYPNAGLRVDWTPSSNNTFYPLALVLAQSAVATHTGAPNSPTSWYWNI